MMLRLAFTAAVATFVLVSCFRPNFNADLACGPGGECPPGQKCGADMACHAERGDLSSPDLELLAGDIGGQGNLDGTGAAARFFLPAGVAADIEGNVYVADVGNGTIRKVTPSGVVTTLAGAAGLVGSADGTGGTAQFNGPLGVAADSEGNVYVADTGNGTIRKIAPAGVVSTLAGVAGMVGNTDGTGAAARFDRPRGVAVDSVGNVYVADTGNDTIRKITPEGVVITLAGAAGMTGSADGPGTAARFDEPGGLVVDSAGNVYVADSGNDTIRKVTPAGVVSTLVGVAGMIGSTDGTGTAARFHNPESVAVDSAGNVYVADTLNVVIRKVTPTGVVTTLAGAAGLSGSADGGAAARFSFPYGLAVDSAGNVYVADAFGETIRKVTPGGVVTTLAGAADMNGSADGTGPAASFYSPKGVAVDNAGNVYVADTGNDTIRKITPGGRVTTLAGAAGMPGGVDGAGAAVRFEDPRGVAVDSAGNVYVTDTGNDTIRKVTPAGVVTTLAGTTGTSGSADGAGAAARFNGPRGVAVDSAGNLYVADMLNNTIRKVTPTGVVTTLAGVAGMPGSTDGGTAARFNGPIGLAVDGAGNVYVADMLNNTIRKVTPAGVVTTLAGAAGTTGSADGTGAVARFHFPAGVAVDSVGNVYVADAGNDTMRKITPTGVTTTIGGAAGMTGVALGTMPRFAFRSFFDGFGATEVVGVTIIGDALIISAANAVLLLRYVAQ